MYKVKIQLLEDIKKQLIVSNKLALVQGKTKEITKLIKENEKLISILEEEYYIV